MKTGTPTSSPEKEQTVVSPEEVKTTLQDERSVEEDESFSGGKNIWMKEIEEAKLLWELLPDDEKEMETLKHENLWSETWPSIHEAGSKVKRMLKKQGASIPSATDVANLCEHLLGYEIEICTDEEQKIRDIMISMAKTDPKDIWKDGDWKEGIGLPNNSVCNLWTGVYMATGAPWKNRKYFGDTELKKTESQVKHLVQDVLTFQKIEKKSALKKRKP